MSCPVLSQNKGFRSSVNASIAALAVAVAAAAAAAAREPSPFSAVVIVVAVAVPVVSAVRFLSSKRTPASLTQSELNNMFKTYQGKTFLLLGFGARGQYKDVNAACRQLDPIIDDLQKKLGNLLVIFGGDKIVQTLL